MLNTYSSVNTFLLVEKNNMILKKQQLEQKDQPSPKLLIPYNLNSLTSETLAPHCENE